MKKETKELIESMVNTITESMSKYSANLDEIMNNIDQMQKLLNSKEFLTTLVNDLINRKTNVVEWKIQDQSGSLENVDSESEKNSFDVDYSFDFTYRYDGKIIPLTIFISGNVFFSRTPYRSGTYMQPAEGGEGVIDYKELGQSLDISLFDKDGEELNIKWLTPQLKTKLAHEIMKDYV